MSNAVDAQNVKTAMTAHGPSGLSRSYGFNITSSAARVDFRTITAPHVPPPIPPSPVLPPGLIVAPPPVTELGQVRKSPRISIAPRPPLTLDVDGALAVVRARKYVHGCLPRRRMLCAWRAHSDHVLPHAGASSPHISPHLPAHVNSLTHALSHTRPHTHTPPLA